MSFGRSMSGSGNQYGVGIAALNMGWLCLEVGRSAEARERFRDAVVALDEAGPVVLRAAARVGHAELAVAEGREEVVAAHLGAAGELVEGALEEADAAASLARIHAAATENGWEAVLTWTRVLLAP